MVSLHRCDDSRRVRPLISGRAPYGEPLEPTWFKSSRSGAHSNRVEVAFLPNNHVGVRDSKNPSAPALMFTPAEWSATTAATTRGEFDY
ncbi:DUF397 domain-containing protein [Nocardia sp. NPDC051990]|uniref:DUF397 domain-containing protein n=1 Tax=Nocardia sp. NPDC051990 TaxID=3155285 RepID=UPI003440EE03